MEDAQIPEFVRLAGQKEKDRLFTEIVNTYRQRMYGVVFGMVKNHDDTDDLLQEAFIKAYQNLHTFKGESSVYTWLVRIAMNQAISHLRKKKFKNMFSLDNLTTPLASTLPGPQRETEYRELQSAVSEAVEQLPEKQRLAFMLRHYDGLSHAEIAQITGKTEGSVKANFFHAINKIKEHLEEKYSDTSTIQGLEYET